MKRDTGQTLMGFPIIETDEFPVAAQGDVVFGQPIYPTMPMCPRCGLAVRFLRRSAFVGDLVPVECGCGWSGVAPVAR